MNSLHAPVAGAAHEEAKPSDAEGISPDYSIEHALQCRALSWQALEDIKSGLREGMTEPDGRVLALEVLQRKGALKHWHQPSLRFGPGTALTFHRPLQSAHALRRGDAVFIDLGPVWAGPDSSALQYEADVGDSFIFGADSAGDAHAFNPKGQQLIDSVHVLFEQGKKRWQVDGWSGQAIYRELTELARTRGCRLLDNVVGHRLGDFPHHQYSRATLPELKHRPSAGLWILELQLVDEDGSQGAFFEDMLVEHAG